MSVIQDPPRTRHEKDRRKIARKKKQARQTRAKMQAHKEECMFKNTLPKLPGSKRPTEFEVLYCSASNLNVNNVHLNGHQNDPQNVHISII